MRTGRWQRMGSGLQEGSVPHPDRDPGRAAIHEQDHLRPDATVVRWAKWAGCSVIVASTGTSHLANMAAGGYGVAAMSAPVITFLSDYGVTDAFVGVCHGVIARLCPSAHVIDLTHRVPRGDVRAGALILHGALPYLQVGVHLAVVDPGVEGDRRAVAV